MSGRARSAAADAALLGVDVERIERLRDRAVSMGLRQTAAGARWLLAEVRKAKGARGRAVAAGKRAGRAVQR